LVTVGNLSFSYAPWNFWDLTSNLEDISFCVLQAVGGYDINISLYCHGHLVATNMHNLTDIQVFPVGWSRMIPGLDVVAVMKDVCFDAYRRLVFCSQPKTVFSKVQLSQNISIDVFIDSRAVEAYRNSVLATYQQTNTLFIAIGPNSTSEIFAYVIISLFGAYFHSFDTTDYEILLMNPDSQMHLVPSLQPLLRHQIQTLAPNVCYTNALFVRAPGFLSPYSADKQTEEIDGIIAHLEYIHRFRSEIKDIIKRKYSPGVPRVAGRVTVTHHFSDRIAQWHSVCPQCQFIDLPDNLTIPELSHVIASSHVFVSGDLLTNLYAMFMHPNATLIDVPPDGAECSQLGRKFATQYYITGYEPEGACTCDIGCVLGLPGRHDGLNSNRIMQAIRWGLKR
jgi:hypothetical protein